MIELNPEDIKIEVIEDRPRGGMWTTGGNPSWVVITHLPTMISARMYGKQQHKSRNIAMAALELMVDEAKGVRCTYHEAVK